MKRSSKKQPDGFSERDDRIVAWVALAALLAVTLIGLGPVIVGSKTFTYRDIGTTHRPAHQLFPSLGEVSLNPHASFGQPYSTNPNLVLRYPFPRAPRWFGAHIVTHLAICLAGMFFFLRGMGVTRAAAMLGAGSFVLSGYVMSSASFLNGITTLAWTPWVLAVVLRLPDHTAALYAAVTISLLSLGGEPVLIVLTLLVAFAIAAAYRGTRGSILFLAAGLLALAITFPIHWSTWQAARDSTRVVTGFSFEAATAASLHPARLLEWIVPYLFGRIDRILKGAWWGFKVSSNQFPLIPSLAFATIALAFAAIAIAGRQTRGTRFWITIGMVSLVLSLGGYLPGSRQLFSLLFFLRHARYPLKLFMVTTLAVSVLAALGFDRWWRGEMPASALRKLRSAAVLLGGLSLMLALAILLRPTAVRDLLVARWWDPAWKISPVLVLDPIVSWTGWRLGYLAVLLPAVGWLLGLPGRAARASRLPSRDFRFWILDFGLARRHNPKSKIQNPKSSQGGRDARATRGGGERRPGWPRYTGTAVAAGLVVITLAEGVWMARPLLLAIPTAVADEPAPMVTIARQLPGRVFERAGKDLDPIRKGVYGNYPTDSLASLAVAQSRQAWALAGAKHGLRYAYDRDPDGSYTFRNKIREDLMARRTWPQRVKWLRGDGIGSVIGYDVPRNIVGLTPLLTEALVGVPATLYRVEGFLPEVRRYGSVVVAGSPEEVIGRFERAGHDPASTIIVEAPDSVAMISSAGAGDAVVEWEGSDAMRIVTRGSGAGMLFVAGSFTRGVSATVNGRSVAVYPANVNLIALPVPAGESRVALRLAE